MDDDRTPATATDTDARRTIARLAVDTVPRLIERLARSELGELEVREDGWRIRLRKPNGANGSSGAESQPQESRDRSRHAVSGTAGQPDRTGSQRSASAKRADSQRGVVASPAVGYFIARDGVTVGTKVRKGDVIGQVDVLGVSQEVVANVEGEISRFDVEPGEAIEYGQPIARLETAASPAADTHADAPEAVMGTLVEA
jgi:acetyl-CoA carboxylase biotin carboxyl carrier protein